MMKYIDDLNNYFGFVNKKDFNYECTYAWTFIFVCLFLSSIILFGVGFIIYTHLLVMAFDTMLSYDLVSTTMAKNPGLSSWLTVVLIGIDLCVIQIIGLSFSDSAFGKLVAKFNKTVIGLGTKVGLAIDVIFAKSLEKGFKHIGSFFNHSFHFVMSKVCNKIEK